MATDEEYLDNLLKSITEKEAQPPKAEEVMLSQEETIPDAVVLPDDDLFSSDDLLSADSMLSGEDLSFEDEILSGNDMLSEENSSFVDEMPSVKAASVSDDEEWMADLKNLMENSAMPEENSDLDTSMNDMNDVDIEDLLSGMGDMDDDLAEISGLLKHADGDESVDMDMLAMLEGISESSESDEAADPFAALLDDSNFEEADGSGQAEEEASPKAKKKRAKKEKSKKKRSLFGKKKRGEQEAGEELAEPVDSSVGAVPSEVQEDDEAEAAFYGEMNTQEEMGEEPADSIGQESGSNMEPEEAALEPEAASGTETEENSENGQEPKEKKKGFFTRLISALTQEEEDVENISEENKEILNELEEEDKKKGQKKGKKGGKKKKGKEAEAEGDPDESAENAEADGKKKKPKKEKKPKEEKPKEKTVKVLSRRNLIVLIAFCATIVGSVILLSFFLPEYADKKSARNAYNAGDYEAVYTLLYDRNLNSSDSLIFNRAATIRKMERRVESYENNLAMGREIEALDSLLKGVSCYQTLTGADEYGVRQEVDAIYQQIGSILEENYGITVEEAIEINAYDNVTYTKRLHSAVSGTSFAGSEEEPAQKETEEASQPQDVLADEEGIINY